MADHPLPVGIRVRHYSQQWPEAREGTATIIAVEGPLHDGTYEYRVRTGREFSREPGPDNPEERTPWWSSAAVIPTPPSTRRQPPTPRRPADGHAR